MNSPVMVLKPGQAGFSLVEMAIVVLILGLLLGGLLQPLRAQIEATRSKETQNQLNSAIEALYGFAASNNARLPCPAFTGSEGNEAIADTSTGQCSNPYNGFIPGRLLGLTPIDANGYLLDAWDQPIHYAVADLKDQGGGYPLTVAPSPTNNRGIKYLVEGSGGSALTGIAALGILTPNAANGPPSSSFLSVCNSATGLANPGSAYTTSGKISTCGSAGNTLVSDALVVLYSTGPNQGQNDSTDEAANPNANNANNDSAFVWHARSEAAASGGGFDDLMVWIPRSLWLSKMIATGQLP